MFEGQPMNVRRAEERGHADHGWLDTHHTFSFASYYDPKHMGFRALRVINDDRVGPGAGFPPHPHRDMEILTYVLDGALEHKDSMGNGSIIRAGDVQRMSAGTGVRHSEFNASPTRPVRFLQIWILPAQQDLAPSYAQRSFEGELHGRLRLVASQDGRADSLSLHQDVSVYAARLAAGEQVEHAIDQDRHAWIQVARGNLELNGTALREGDGVALSEAGPLVFTATDETEFLLFDLA